MAIPTISRGGTYAFTTLEVEIRGTEKTVVDEARPDVHIVPGLKVVWV